MVIFALCSIVNFHGIMINFFILKQFFGHPSRP
jgi:uncharacterized membrane protein